MLLRRRIKDEIILSFGIPEKLAEYLETTVLNFQALGIGSADYFMLGLRRAFEGNGYSFSELIRICEKNYDYCSKVRKVKRLSSARRLNHIGATFPGRSIRSHGT